MIFDLKDQGLNTGEISRKLTEMGYLSVRGKPLLSKHVWSMIKKNRVRRERSKEFQREIGNFRWVVKFYDKMGYTEESVYYCGKRLIEDQ